MTRKAPEETGRRSIRLRGYDYSQAGAYYVTIVSSSREYLFGEVVEDRMVLNRFGQIAKTQWERLPRRFRHVELGEFVVMPNHIHGIIYIVDGRDTPDHGGGIVDGRGSGHVGALLMVGARRTMMGALLMVGTRRIMMGALLMVGARRTMMGALLMVGARREDFGIIGLETLRRAPTGDLSTRHAPTEQFGKPIPGSLPTIIRSYKSAVALRVNLSRQTRDTPVWQRNYYEHIIRNQADYERIAGYILDNPINWNQDEENPAGKGNAPRRD